MKKSATYLEKENEMNDDVLDLQEFLDRVQDDKDLLLELLDIFSEDYQVKRKGLDLAVSQKNYEDLRGIAHSLKGATGNISAKSLRMLFMKLEEMGKNNTVDGAAPILIHVDEEFKKFQERVSIVKKELQ